MNKKKLSILLLVVVVICFAGMASYPIKYFYQKDSNEDAMEALRDLRRSALIDSADPTQSVVETVPVTQQPTATVKPTAEPRTPEPPLASMPVSQVEEGVHPEASEEAVITNQPETTVEPTRQAIESTIVPDADLPEVTLTVTTTTEPVESAQPTEEPQPEITDRYYRESSALPYTAKEIVKLDPDMILPSFKDIYEQNNDLVGWLYIADTPVDYPVLQSEVRDYYLNRDFYGKYNSNGQLILDSACDPWTPSYNLVISGHNMISGKMFGQLKDYSSKYYWADHKLIEFDSLIREGTYVVFAAFFSADYDVNEEGFRYNADIRYELDAELWLEEVFENRLYNTGIDVEFGDEFLTLTTCMYQRENGRFVVVARRVREGEVIE